MNSGKLAINLNDRSEFSQLFSTYEIQVFRYLYGLTGGPQEDVEDLTSETFSRAWISRRNFNGNSESARNWLFTIAKNQVVDNYRKEKSRGAVLSIENVPALQLKSTPENSQLQNEQREILWRLLLKLPEEAKEILVLRYMLEWKVIEIADYLNKKEGTISMTIHRALKQLQKLWPGKDE